MKKSEQTLIQLEMERDKLEDELHKLQYHMVGLNNEKRNTNDKIETIEGRLGEIYTQLSDSI
ncbi:TPA: hypothetical protein QCU10_005828 [Bacillus anthracis]|nr:hypothetical protein [Bacillus cereus biovar anthracis]HDR6230948.1 hypothetical protein [Bacillus cereus biovar anthracis]HDR6240475.1 hypothetical protein [Bacillus cereus biovar anthracis]HDR6252419.1 hypothetical protein [Bacillus cereus biovar anthracis]HDR6254204.1 hypothetical protein [Bacillus cereus biovar anthracis]